MKHPRFLPSLAVLVAVPLMAAVVGSPSSVAEDNTADDAAIARAAYDPASDTERPVVEWDGGNGYFGGTSTGLLDFKVTDADPDAWMTISLDADVTSTTVEVDDNGHVKYQIADAGRYNLWAHAYDHAGHHTDVFSGSFVYDDVRPTIEFQANDAGVVSLGFSDQKRQGHSDDVAEKLMTWADCVPAAEGEACAWQTITSSLYLYANGTVTGADGVEYKQAVRTYDVNAATDGTLLAGTDLAMNAAEVLISKESGTVGSPLDVAPLNDVNEGEGAVFSVDPATALPAGLFVDPATGAVVGTPTEVADSALVAINVSYSDGWSTLAGLTQLTIGEAPVVEPTPDPTVDPTPDPTASPTTDPSASDTPVAPGSPDPSASPSDVAPTSAATTAADHAAGVSVDTGGSAVNGLAAVAVVMIAGGAAAVLHRRH